MEMEISSRHETTSNSRAVKRKAISIQRKHTTPDIDPLEAMQYERRSCKIHNADGSMVFELHDAEVPASWSQLASDILISKYFRRSGVPEMGHETSIKQVIRRIVKSIRLAGERGGYFGSPVDAESFEAEMSYLLVEQHGAFNSPVWFNAGLHEAYGIQGNGEGYFYDEAAAKVHKLNTGYERPQASACFIQSVDDSLSSIFDLLKNESRVFKYGSGTGTNFSALRGSMERIAGGGTSSGLISFLEVLDRGAGATKSGGTTRRAAKMVCLDVDHPEIENFINWKVREEKKVAALVAAGYSSDFNGEAYHTIAGQNSNNSVRLPDKFLLAVLEDGPWETRLRTTGEVHKTYRARELFENICHAAWTCADPGVQFDSTIQRWHTCPASGRINASNPCSEFMFLDDSACNLASINLMKYLLHDGSFDIHGFRHACRVFFIAQEILVGHSSYPTERIAKNAHDYRPLGLGYANLGSLLMVSGIPYDSDAARAWCGAISGLMQGEALKASAELAATKGPFAGYAKNREAMLHVVSQHLEAVNTIPDTSPSDLRAAAKESLTEALLLGRRHGYRNAQATVLAPTGTIGLLMDCDTTGIEPDFAIVKFKKLAGGGYFKIVNQSVPSALRKLGYSEKEISGILQHVLGTLSLENETPINKTNLTKKGLAAEDLRRIEAALPGALNLLGAFHRLSISEDTLTRLGISASAASSLDFNLLESLGFTPTQIEEAEKVICGRMTLENCPILRPEDLAVFDCANKCGKSGTRYLSPMSHLKMMAAAQPFLSGAISKTVNLPNEATVNDIRNVYIQSWKLGLKAVTVYRDGSKLSQPLSASSETKKAPAQRGNVADLAAPEFQLLLDEVISQAEILGLPTKSRRRPLPKKRTGLTVEAKVGGHKIYVRTGEYPDGGLAEVFIDMHKEGAAFRSLMNCLAISVSKGLQYGVPLEEFVDTFTFTRFEPNGVVDHENIKTATSVVDYVFRLLGLEYLNRTDFVHIQPEKTAEPPQSTLSAKSASQHYDHLMGDAPPCSSCGHTTVRNGSCYRCFNCGQSMGCS